ncbi:hypothetical protein OG785_45205 [Streptomyces sp. NBC_00006]|uniref:hypothetical protein n=1 Tax=Streptomyces sp. NBC_00006 TaxID=2975619 RepID=UPI002255D54F|nr:hypothetical protein [Streptomyces sp. NBC_00006]MCX5529010.1 hypothetical protein [Streptomyces sp. NBC_00006]MCX5537758.1 hypothetical protein [Streptomyces sp. NBC_00006]
MTIVLKAPEPRPVTVGDVLVAKPFGSRTMLRGRVFMVTRNIAYFYCTPLACPTCGPDGYDASQRMTHSVWRNWLDWYREGNDEDRSVQEALADRRMRIWDPNTRSYVEVPDDSRATRPAA